MIAIFDFIPQTCPSCGTQMRIKNGTPSRIAQYISYHADTCSACGLKYQFAEQKDILRAATASGGTLVNLVIHTHPSDGE